MPPVFRPSANLIARSSILGLLLLLGLAALFVFGYNRSTYVTGVHVVINQPVPFSHAHHVAGLGIDCRYCHTSVENAGFAGMPSTNTCMNCHAQLWTNAELLEPVRESWRTGQPIRWTRVNDVPDFVYFNHSIHVQKGIGCSTCHGRVDQMPLMVKAVAMHMEWCLDCHRDPAQHIRPRDQVFNMAWQPPADQPIVGQRLVEAYHVQTDGLTNCTICHR